MAESVEEHAGEEQAVLVHFLVPQSEFDLETYYPLEDKLIAVLDSSDVGEFDGNEVGPLLDDPNMVQYSIYTYGEDADAVADLVMPEVCGYVSGAEVTIARRYGEPGAPEAVWIPAE